MLLGLLHPTNDGVEKVSRTMPWQSSDCRDGEERDHSVEEKLANFHGGAKCCSPTSIRAAIRLAAPDKRHLVRIRG